MVALKRIDEQVGNVTITQKEMPNGETRTRTKFLDGTTSSLTTMGDWPCNESLPWQEAHYHVGLIEDYLVLEGWICIVACRLGERPIYMTYRAGTHSRIDPDIAHSVLLGPHTMLVTATHGSPVGNPEKKGNDWWPYPDIDTLIEQDMQGPVGFFIKAMAMGIGSRNTDELDDIEYPR